MPIWLRKFNINQVNDFNKKQQEAMDLARGQSNIGDDKIQRPNINPSSTYNF